MGITVAISLVDAVFSIIKLFTVKKKKTLNASDSIGDP